MLPPYFIRAWKRKLKIRLLYASEDKLSLVKTLVAVHEEHVDKTRGELKKALNGCEELGFNYKLVRGLSAVLEERCIFQSRTVIEPQEARRVVFEEAAGSDIATEEDRKRVLSTVAFRMHISADDLDRSLFADLQDEQVLTDFETIPPLDLLKEYNFALTLALLAHARRLELTYRGRAGELEDLCGKVGRCSVQEVGRTSKMAVEWRPTRRIGYKAAHLENLLACLLSKEAWGLAADIKYPLKSRKTYRFEISGDLEGKLMKTIPRVQKLSVKTTSKYIPPTRSKDEIIDITETALRLGITEDEVRKRYREVDGYIELGGILITKDKLDEVEKALANVSDMQLDMVQGTLRRLGCRSPLPVLEALGYDVEWAKDRNKSVVYRIRRRRPS